MLTKTFNNWLILHAMYAADGTKETVLTEAVEELARHGISSTNDRVDWVTSSAIDALIQYHGFGQCVVHTRKEENVTILTLAGWTVI